MHILSPMKQNLITWSNMTEKNVTPYLSSIYLYISLNLKLASF